jgi:plasmid stabilization system protein ParE
VKERRRGARVRIEAAFLRDLSAQISWLEGEGRPGQIERLETGIDEVIELLSRLPRVGALDATHGAAELRRLLLRRLPFVVWFSTDAAPGVWLLRLFHVRQDRPRSLRAKRRRLKR